MRSVRALLFIVLISLFPHLYACAAISQPSAVATAHPLATDAGVEILQAGGNAFDAAVAVTAVLAVVEPYSSGLGGGGFWLLHRACDGYQVMIDGREKAPAEARRDMYLDQLGAVRERASIDGPLAAGIPGVPAGIVHLAKRYAKQPLARTLAPAIRLARDGFPVTERYQRLLGFRLKTLQASPPTAAIFLVDNEPPSLGHMIRQPHLAGVLEAIVEQGAAGFYKGATAERLVAGIRAAGGIWQLADLADYQIVEREPIRAEYHGMRIVSAAPPSSGGIVLAQILNILEHHDLGLVEETTRKHLIIEAMRHAYRDRAAYLGDPDYTTIPVTRLISDVYAKGKAEQISPRKATRSARLPGITETSQGADTTHFSILDAQGNRVAATLSINLPFGSGFVAPGTGILLNNEMDDFAIHPMTPNSYGLVGDEANAIAPGKRPLSSMTPSFLETEDRVAILGTPGGSRIISMVLLAALDFVAGNPPTAWVALPRFHHQYLPDEVQYEKGGLNVVQQKALGELGHTLKELNRQYGNMQAILLNKKTHRLEAASDPRGEGKAVVFDRVGP